MGKAVQCDIHHRTRLRCAGHGQAFGGLNDVDHTVRATSCAGKAKVTHQGININLPGCGRAVAKAVCGHGCDRCGQFTCGHFGHGKIGGPVSTRVNRCRVRASAESHHHRCPSLRCAGQCHTVLCLNIVDDAVGFNGVRVDCDIGNSIDNQVVCDRRGIAKGIRADNCHPG